MHSSVILFPLKLTRNGIYTAPAAQRLLLLPLPQGGAVSYIPDYHADLAHLILSDDPSLQFAGFYNKAVGTRNQLKFKYILIYIM